MIKLLKKISIVMALCLCFGVFGAAFNKKDYSNKAIDNKVVQGDEEYLQMASAGGMSLDSL